MLDLGVSFLGWILERSQKEKHNSRGSHMLRRTHFIFDLPFAMNQEGVPGLETWQRARHNGLRPESSMQILSGSPYVWLASPPNPVAGFKW